MSQHEAVFVGAGTAVLAIVLVRMFHRKKTFHEALIEAVIAVSALLTATAFVVHECDVFFPSDAKTPTAVTVVRQP